MTYDDHGADFAALVADRDKYKAALEAIREAIKKQMKEAGPGMPFATPLRHRVPVRDQRAADWEEFDPREEPDCSAYGEMPA